MRKFIFILTALFLLNHTIIAQFTWLNPKPSGFSNSKIAFVNTDTGYLFNSNSELFKTYDGGITWAMQQRFPGAVAMDIKDSTGVISGYSGVVYISTDNGITWQQKSTGFGDNFLKIDIISRDTILLINPNAGTIFKSTNRGNSWQVSGIANPNMIGVDFTQSNLGYISKYTGIFKTTDGGTTWQNIYPISSSAGVLVIKFFNSNYGLAYREFDTMLKTTDGGVTWTSAAVHDEIFDIFFIDQTNIFAVGELGMVYRSTDGAQTWVNINPGPRIWAHDLYSQHFFNTTTGIAVGLRGRIIKTTDAGVNWQEYATTYTDISDLSFGSNNVGYAISGLNIYKTVNKGQDWNRLNFQIPNVWNSNSNHCLFFSADTGIVTATHPCRVYKTNDGGLNWSVTTGTPGGYDYTSGLSFLNKSTGFATFRNSSAYGLFKTVDGGSNWQEIGSYQNYYEIQFFNEQFGYASKLYPGRLYKTLDGGNTWTQLLELPSGDLKTFHFISPARGIVGGSQGFLKMTLDSGRTWLPVSPLNFYSDFLDVKFYNDQVGFATGEYNKIFRTTDGGLNWSSYNQFNYYNCPVITYTSDTSVYLAGGFGSILTTQVHGYRIDSLKVDSLTACSAVFSSKISAIASAIDSVWFQYWTTNYNNNTTLAASPFSLAGETKIVKANAANLPMGVSYKLRVKIYYRGSYFYSDSIFFNTSFIPKPVITVNGNTLTSSLSTGNQWYRDALLIAGANNQQHTATTSGTYTVQSTQNGCLSQMSDPVTVTVTSIFDLQLDRDVSLLPNPTRDLLYLKNAVSRNLEIRIKDLYGKQVLGTVSRDQLIQFSLQKLPAGFYFVFIRDISKDKMTIKRLIKF